MTTGTKSGLSNDLALASKVASSNCQCGDHSFHSSRQTSRRFWVSPASPRGVWK